LSQIEAIGNELTSALKGYNADYIEAHFEQSNASHITYRGRELESIGRTTAIGGNVRALVRGGWGFTSFNSLDDLPSRIELAIKQAQIAGKEQSKLAPVEPVVDKVPTGVDKNPADIPLADKKQLLDEYNDIIWQTPKLQTSVINYGDSHKKSIFISSTGSHIEQERADVILRLAAIATDGNEVQQANLSLGSRGDFNQIQNLHQQVAEMASRSVKLLSAPRVKGGEYTVVLDPVLAGVFVQQNLSYPGRQTGGTAPLPGNGSQDG
jgi:TldD protein